MKSICLRFLGDLKTYAATDAILHKTFNTFFHPIAASAIPANKMSNGYYSPEFEMEWQVQIGSKLYPEMSVRSVSESMYQLLKCVGILNSSVHSLDITNRDYYTYKHIIGLDLEKMLQAGFTGLNSKAGDLITIKSKCLSDQNAAQATHICIILHADIILNIRDNGVEVFE